MIVSNRLFDLAIVAFCSLLTSPGLAAAQDIDPSLPGPEHNVLVALTGAWEVFLGDKLVGSATARSRLGNRFIEIEIIAEEGRLGHVIYTFGFDRRHEQYTVVAMDDTGTYWVTASGTRDGTAITMNGQDEDPVMRAMGLDKEFVIVLDVFSSNHITIETRFVDTRTPERREMSFHTFDLRRARVRGSA